jgi:predicted dehydrogenase
MHTHERAGRVRVGVIGTNWGRMHIGAFREAGADVVALCGQRPEHTREVAAQEGIPLATTDVRALCAAVDAVVVASPDGLHRAHVEAALSADRAVLCEKPLTRTEEDALALVERSRASRRPCAVNFPYRMLPPLRALRDWLAGRTPHQLVITLRNGFAGVEPDGSGALMGASGDLGGMSHLLDAALWLTRTTPRWVQASLLGRPVHSAALHVGLSSGTVLVLTHVACAEPGLHGGWSVLGRGWEAGFSGGYVPSAGGWCVSPVRRFEDGTWSDLAPGLQPQPGAREPWAEAHVETARRFLALLDGGSAPAPALATLEEAATVQRILAAALTSEQEGRRVPLPPLGPTR